MTETLTAMLTCRSARPGSSATATTSWSVPWKVRAGVMVSRDPLEVVDAVVARDTFRMEIFGWGSGLETYCARSTVTGWPALVARLTARPAGGGAATTGTGTSPIAEGGPPAGASRRGAGAPGGRRGGDDGARDQPNP